MNVVVRKALSKITESHSAVIEDGFRPWIASRYPVMTIRIAAGFFRGD